MKWARHYVCLLPLVFLCAAPATIGLSQTLEPSSEAAVETAPPAPTEAAAKDAKGTVDTWIEEHIDAWLDCVFKYLIWSAMHLYSQSDWSLSEKGWYLESGDCFFRNPKGAFKLYRSRAMNGDQVAALLLGHLYLKGLGVPRSVEKARFWFDFAVLRDIRLSRKSQVYYVNLIMGRRGIPPELMAAIDRGRKRLDGDGIAIYRIAMALLDGTGGWRKNPAVAKQLASTAMSARKMPWRYKYNYFLDLLENRFETSDPRDRRRDIANAVSGLFTFSRIPDHGNSQKHLARVFAAGKLVPKDNFFAYVFFRLAQKNGVNVANDLLLIKPLLSPEQIAQAEEDIRKFRYIYHPRYRDVVDALWERE